MRPHKRSDGLIKAKKSGCEQGSIVVEAALVMPLLMLVLLAFVMLIRLCAVQMALHSAASQTIMQIAAHIHPAELAWKQAAAAVPPASLQGAQLEPWSEIAAEAAEWLPSPAGPITSSALRGDFRPLQNAAATELGRTIVEPLLREYADTAILSPERLRLSQLTLPDLEKNNDSYLTISIQYEFPLKLPIIGKPIVLREQAAERVWISDAAPARYGQAEMDTDAIPLQIVSIAPMPLRPGRKAAVLVKTSPNASITLGVMYKSGSSKAKHLGAAVANRDGYVTWNWLVSGNTTPGVWELTVSETSNAANKASMHFIVEKSNSSAK